ncbi:hypothetical protein ACIQM3_11680 [Streptomyces sp. NPDC091271]|uniref:hypothetical protein n=1 Tax=Streptomyces sp. NPDC091271 TaxID=3365980 RepID=UPI0037F30E11
MRLRPSAYDSGDGLHPDDAGTRAVADAVDVGMLLAGPLRRISPATEREAARIRIHT